ncbi:MAG: hypothetical protein ABI780_05790 [Ardenticatenales bacterium]
MNESTGSSTPNGAETAACDCNGGCCNGGCCGGGCCGGGGGCHCAGASASAATGGGCCGGCECGTGGGSASGITA